VTGIAKVIPSNEYKATPKIRNKIKIEKEDREREVSLFIYFKASINYKYDQQNQPTTENKTKSLGSS